MTATSGAPTPNRPESDPSKLSDVEEEDLFLLQYFLGSSNRNCWDEDDGRKMEEGGGDIDRLFELILFVGRLEIDENWLLNANTTVDDVIVVVGNSRVKTRIDLIILAVISVKDDDAVLLVLVMTTIVCDCYIIIVRRVKIDDLESLAVLERDGGKRAQCFRR